MTPETQLRLIHEELQRWLSDERESPVREAVHVDRMAWIMGYRGDHTGVSS